jgi:hypothetical protein
MNDYQFTIGNNLARKGHRHDCGQLEAVILVTADDYPDALQKLALGQGRIVIYRTGPIELLGSAQCIEIKAGETAGTIIRKGPRS